VVFNNIFYCGVEIIILANEVIHCCCSSHYQWHYKSQYN